MADKAQFPNAAPKVSAAADPKISKSINPATKPAIAKELPEPAEQAEDAEADPDDDEEPEIVNLNLNAGFNPTFTFLFIIVMILAAYALPIFIAFGAPISGFIFAFALWEAWKMNRKVRLVINGPFHLAADQPMDLPAEDFDDEQ